MVIGLLSVELFIPHAQSLKDKRMVLRSIKDRLKKFNVSVAEVEETNLWNRATVGVVSISGSHDYLEGLMQNVEKAALRIANNAGAEVVDSYVEIE